MERKVYRVNINVSSHEKTKFIFNIVNIIIAIILEIISAVERNTFPCKVNVIELV